MGLAPVSFWSSRPVAASACSLSGTWSASRYCGTSWTYAQPVAMTAKRPARKNPSGRAITNLTIECVSRCRKPTPPPSSASLSTLFSSLRIEQRRERRHDNSNGRIRDEDRQQRGNAERADQGQLGERERHDRDGLVHRRQQAGRRHVEHGVARRRDPVDAGDDIAPDRKHQMHRIREAGDEDQRRDDVDEKVQAEIETAEHAERPEYGNDWARDRDQRQRHPAEEEIGHAHAGHEPEAVVDEPVALHRILDLELHHRRAGELECQPRALKLLVDGILDAADYGPRRLLLHHGAIERDDDERELTVVGEELALDDIVRSKRRDHGIVAGVVLG